MNQAVLKRETFTTSRLLDFFSVKELTAQIGHAPAAWPLVVLKELVDNALDACEEAGIPPSIEILVDESGITVTDNGPGLPADTVQGVLDFAVRVSSREAYVAPDRGAQGNALKTLIAMPFVLDGETGSVEIEALGVRHSITCTVDRIRQVPCQEHFKNVPAGRRKSVPPSGNGSLLVVVGHRRVRAGHRGAPDPRQQRGTGPSGLL